jgi:DnaJ-domain-containing protein 1
MRTVPTIEKLRAAGLVLLGCLLFWSGTRAPGPARLLMVVGGAWLIATQSRRFFALREAERRYFRQWRDPVQARLREELRAASLPRQLFWLLFAVAEVDGKPGAAEREAVRRFLLQRFPDPVTQADLAGFEASRVPPEQVEAIAYDLRRALTPQERDTVFFWACLVAFADGRFAREEHEALQRVARGLGIEAQRARRIFWHAKARTVGGPQEGAWENRSERRFEQGAQQQEHSRPRARGVVTDRGRALEVLGLPRDATQEQIRTRHRELVKEHHPDAHTHLGPVAAQEATERFREVQAAYELLSR